MAGAASSAVFTLIVLLWWVGALGGPNDLGVKLLNGFDISTALRDIHAALYWPVAVILGARMAFDVVRVLSGSPVRVTAAGDVVFAVANMGVLAWMWVASPLSELIRVYSVGEFWQRLLSREGWAMDSVPTLLMAIVVFGFIGELVRAVQALASLVLDRKVGAKD